MHHKVTKSLAIVLAAIFPLGCTWVEPTEEGYAVALVKSTATQHCQSLGTVTAEVPDNIGPFTRSDQTVINELITLGKNEAARLGGDTMVEAGPVSFGRQPFKVYRCE